MRHTPLLTFAGLAWYLALAVVLRDWPLPKAPSDIVAPPAPEALALGFLATSDAFYSGAIGYAGTPSPQALAWNTLLQLPRADSLFQHQFEVGNRAGQLYALAGLYYVDSIGFRRAEAQLAGIKEDVEAMEGCVLARRPLTDLLAEVRSGRWSGMLRTIRPFPKQLLN